MLCIIAQIIKKKLDSFCSPYTTEMSCDIHPDIIPACRGGGGRRNGWFGGGGMDKEVTAYSNSITLSVNGQFPW